MLDTSITADPTAQLAEALQQQAMLEEQLRDEMKAQQEAASAKVASIGSMLQKIATERVTLRSAIEQRWLKAIKQINAIYEDADFKLDEGTYGSRVYVPLTRRLRNMIVARLGDMLFPSDNRSWVLSPSPLAELNEAGQTIADMDPEAPVPDMPPGTKISDIQAAIQEVQKEAEASAARMQRQVDDRLAESKWAAKARRVIDDAVDLGTGVIKGPVATRRRTRVWSIDPATGKATMKEKFDIVSSVEYVDLWNFYPDMSAARVEDCIDICELHPMARKELRGLREQPGFNAAAIDMLLSSEPTSDTVSRRQDLRQIADLSGAEDPRYMVWEYHGPLKGSDLNACYDHERLFNASEGEGEQDMGYDEPQYDEDEDYSAVVWFCNGVVIKAIVQPLDSEQKHIYSTVCWQRDKASIFGYGLPDEVRDQQSSANGSFRAMLDNMGLCVGPQIVFDDELVEAVDGRKTISPMKLWRKKSGAMGSIKDAFAFFQIDSRMEELGNIFDRSKGLMDEVATIPAFTAGTEQPNYMQSATGASLAYNASTLWVRRFVRQWDDEIVEPTMGRMVEWELDFNPDDSIKGDYHPVAKGITSLVELEGQGARMTQFIQLSQQMGVPPRDQMRILRQFARSLKLDPDEILPTEDEIKGMADKAPDPESMRLEVQSKNAQLVHDAKMKTLSLKEAEMEGRRDETASKQQLALMQLASQEKLTMEQAAAKYGFDIQRMQAEQAENEAQRRHQAQMQNAEIAVKIRAGSGI
jgi:hypothetical protein